MVFVVIGILVVCLIIIISCIHIVPQANAYVIERLGMYHATWKTGMHIKVPFIDNIAKKINLMEQVHLCSLRSERESESLKVNTFFTFEKKKKR